MSTAESQLGVTETPGDGNTLQVLKYLYSTDTGNPGSDKTPWCGAFCNWTLRKENVPSLRSAQAWSQAYKNLGVTLSQPALGSIAVLDYGDGTGHVGFVAGTDGNGGIVLLGGNQSDQVKYSVFPASSISSYVYPAGPWAINYNLPVLNVNSINPNTR